MRTLLAPLALLAALAGLGCGFLQPDPPVPVALCACEAGPYRQLPRLFDLKGEGAFSSRPRHLTPLMEASTPFTAEATLTSEGTYLVLMAEDPRQGQAPVPFGTYAAQPVDSPQAPASVPVFRQPGQGEWALGADASGTLLAFGEAGTRVLGALAYRSAYLPDGTQQTLVMHRGALTGNTWVGDLEGRIYRERTEGHLVQIGWVGWRRAVLPGGRRVPMLMTRGLGRRAFWAGRHQGTWYRDPEA